MCFNYDYDWRASVVENRTSVIGQPEWCDECGRLMPPGATMHSIYLQEHEECGRCEEGDCECPENQCCQCPEPDIGETFAYQRCHDCEQFLAAIEEAESEAGCMKHEARPPLGEMQEALCDSGSRESERYFQTAAKHYPGLLDSGFLYWLWDTVFQEKLPPCGLSAIREREE